jgi:hypothetical protein
MFRLYCVYLIAKYIVHKALIFCLKLVRFVFLISTKMNSITVYRNSAVGQWFNSFKIVKLKGYT